MTTEYESALSRSPWDEFRAAMPVAERWAYFDHAAVAPLSEPAKKAVRDWAAQAAANGDVDWPSWRRCVESLRNRAAGMINADAAEIAIVRNTTEGIGLVAEGYPWRPGDNVVVPAGEFPSNLYPWLNLQSRGVEVRMVPTENERLDLDQLADACDARTRIVSVSWVGYATGWRNDVAALAEVAHRRGALLFLDAIQGLGVFPLDVAETPVDFLAADGHKWMLGPEGAGLFYVRREHLERLRPLGVGWNSVAHAGDYTNPWLNLRTTAQRYEGGSYNMVGIAGLDASLELLQRNSAEQIAQQLLTITDRICQRLGDVDAEIASCRDDARNSGIIAFELPGCDPLELKRHCLDHGVVCTSRAGRLRLSPHVYTNDHDLDRLFAALEEFPRD